ncbi:hypothetical protein JKF63_01575 [Porcisia hertigi]|uniref:TFIIS central domain-containing protein n=1 Tax=Porcisia hertigi TaxID=2761500 RepID=A0A836KZS6_9TRYP|nr:hypothetical protein JKF63_01575 [Porcisia hertigi]
MSDSEWGSDSGASNTEANVASALSMHLVKLMSSRLPSRVTHRRCAPTPVGGASSTRAALSSSSRATGEATRSQTRIDVCSVIRQALSQSQAQCPSANVDDIASRVAAALRQCGEGGDVARAVTRALADPLNEKLRESVLTGRLSPEELVALDELSLLSHTERERLERARQARLDQYSVEYFDRLNNTVTHMFTCPACESRECYAHFRSTDFVKWQGDDETPTLLRCCKCSLSFRQ